MSTIDPAKVGARRATTDIAIQLVGRVLNVALGVVVTALVVRALGQSGYGQWSTVFVIVQLTGYFADLGLGQVTVRQVTGDREREAQWLGALVSLRFLLGLLMTVVSMGVTVLIAESNAMLVAGLLASTAIMLSGPSAFFTVFQLRVRNDITTALITVNSVLWGGAVFVIAASDGGLVPFAVGFLAATIVTSGLQAFYGLRMAHVDLRGSRPFWRELARVGVPIGIGSLLITAYGRIDQVLVFEIAGSSQAGLYGAVYRIVEQSQLLPVAVTTTLFPIIAATYETNRERVGRIVESAARYLTMGSLGALAVALVASHQIVRLLFGPEFDAAAPALPILMGAFVLMSYGYLSGYLIIVLHLQRRFINYALIALIFNVAVNLIFVPSYGFLAAAWATLATEALVLALSVRVVLKNISIPLHPIRFASIAGAAVTLALGLWGLREAGVPLAGVLAAAVVGYPVLLFGVRALTRREIVALLRKEAP